MTDPVARSPEPKTAQVPAEAVAVEQAILKQVLESERPTIEDYCRACAEYIRMASRLTSGQAKATQIALSGSGILAKVMLEDLRDALNAGLHGAITGERSVGGGLREAKADVSEVTGIDGLKLAVELKPIHLAVGRAIWNRFGDIRIFATNIHLKFPFAVVGGVLTLPTQERVESGNDEVWKSTTHLVERAVARMVRAGGRETEAGAPHLLEGVGVVVYDHATGLIVPDLPQGGTGLRWEEFIGQIAFAYDARFGPI